MNKEAAVLGSECRTQWNKLGVRSQCGWLANYAVMDDGTEPLYAFKSVAADPFDHAARFIRVGDGATYWRKCFRGVDDAPLTPKPRHFIIVTFTEKRIQFLLRNLG